MPDEKKPFLSGPRSRIFLAIVLTVVLAGALSWWGVYGIETYGMGLFVLTPLLIGLCPTVVYGYGCSINLTE